MFGKLNWLLGVVLIFLMIFFTNFIDRDNFREIQASINTIYEDRLVVSNLVFELSRAVQQKELANATSDADFYGAKNIAVNKEINRLLTEFRATKLTPEEQRTLDELQTNLDRLIALEKNTAPEQKENIAGQLNKINANLSKLSEIQVTEGKRQMKESEYALKASELFTTIETYFLVGMGIVVLAFIFYTLERNNEKKRERLLAAKENRKATNN